MAPLQKSAENTAAGFPTSDRIHHDQNFRHGLCSSIFVFYPATAAVNIVELLTISKKKGQPTTQKAVLMCTLNARLPREDKSV